MMETPYLDKMINDLQNHIESIEVAVHAGIPETRSELAEYEAIKTKLKSMVSSSSVSDRFYTDSEAIKKTSDSQKMFNRMYKSDEWRE